MFSESEVDSESDSILSSSMVMVELVADSPDSEIFIQNRLAESIKELQKKLKIGLALIFLTYVCKNVIFSGYYLWDVVGLPKFLKDESEVNLTMISCYEADNGTICPATVILQSPNDVQRTYILVVYSIGVIFPLLGGILGDGVFGRLTAAIAGAVLSGILSFLLFLFTLFWKSAIRIMGNVTLAFFIVSAEMLHINIVTLGAVQWVTLARSNQENSNVATRKYYLLICILFGIGKFLGLALQPGVIKFAKPLLAYTTIYPGVCLVIILVLCCGKMQRYYMMHPPDHHYVYWLLKGMLNIACCSTMDDSNSFNLQLGRHDSSEARRCAKNDSISLMNLLPSLSSIILFSASLKFGVIFISQVLCQHYFNFAKTTDMARVNYYKVDAIVYIVVAIILYILVDKFPGDVLHNPNYRVGLGMSCLIAGLLLSCLFTVISIIPQFPNLAHNAYYSLTAVIFMSSFLNASNILTYSAGAEMFFSVASKNSKALATAIFRTGFSLGCVIAQLIIYLILPLFIEEQFVRECGLGIIVILTICNFVNKFLYSNCIESVQQS